MKTDDAFLRRMACLPVPPPDPAARDRAFHQAVVALQTARRVKPDTARPWVGFLSAHGWELAGGVVMVVVLASHWLAFGIRRPDRERRPTLTAETVVLHQMELLFGPQLDAVVEPSGHAPDIRLSPDPVVPADGFAQAVLIEFHRAGGPTTRVLGYSGRAVCVTLAGRRTCFEPLVTGNGGVILDGERFCWTTGQPFIGLDNYRITAHPLPRS